MLNLLLLRPPKAGSSDDKFEVTETGRTHLYLGKMLLVLGRADDKTPVTVTRGELLVSGLNPPDLCKFRFLKPLDPNGPEKFGATAAEVVAEILDAGQSKDTTRALSRALDFCAALATDGEQASKIAPTMADCPAGETELLDGLAARVPLSPACLKPLVEALDSNNPQRSGAADFAARLLMARPVDSFAGKAAFDAVEGVSRILLAGPGSWDRGILVRLCEIISALRPPRTFEVWRSVHRLATALVEPSDRAALELRDAAERCLFVLTE